MPTWTPTKKISVFINNTSSFIERVIFDGTTYYIQIGGSLHVTYSTSFTLSYDTQAGYDVTTTVTDGLVHQYTIFDSLTVPGTVSLRGVVLASGWSTPQKDASGYPYERTGFLYEMSTMLYEYFGSYPGWAPTFKRTLSYLLKEDTYFLLLEDGGKIVLDYGTEWSSPLKSA